MAARKAARRPARRARKTAPAAGRKVASRRGKTTRRAAARRKAPARKTARAASKKSRRPPTRRPAKTAARRPARGRKTAPAAKAKAAPPRTVAPKPPAKTQATAKPAPTPRLRPAAKPALDRARRQLPPEERLKDAADERLLSSVRSGGNELKHLIDSHNESSPTLTAGDVDAHWEDAYAIGDEAPGGDNPTPEQDRVDDIGKALGVTYEDNEELQGSEKIIERDKHRWELDPASSDDWPHGKE
jgi:hypothetical protein